jgi:hypothetical protein
MSADDVLTVCGACIIPAGKEHAGKFMAQTLTFPFETEDAAFRFAEGIVRLCAERIEGATLVRKS